MNQIIFNKLIALISSQLKIMEEMGQPISTEIIGERIDYFTSESNQMLPELEISETESKNLKFAIGQMFNVKVGEAAIMLHNRDLPRWFDNKKSEISWDHWSRYKSMLEQQGRPSKIIEANEEVINSILDYSGDPRETGSWSRKGLVMGNVQSGKTQNYLGLINKAIDCGYRTIILLGGHLNDLRKQTQERVDEGVLGIPSRHLVEAETETPQPIGVGMFGPNSVHAGTSTIGDFNKGFADRYGTKLTGNDPVIFTIKKHTGVMQRLFKWIKGYHYLDPETGKKLEGPLLLIDDEADYASINTKHHKDEVTRTNESIRQLLSLFKRNTYVGYTATPFANIFIDPDDNSYSVEDDLFPSDFMIKIPVPDNYMGQDFFFGEATNNELGSEVHCEPTIPIKDHLPVYELKKDDEIHALPDSLKEAVRAFLLVIAIRSLRDERYAHNTMLVNISHLKVHQNRLELLIGSYHKEINNALASFSGLGFVDARNNPALKQLEETFNKVFSVPEDYKDVFGKLSEASGKVKVWAINQSNSKDEGRELNYSIHKENGLCAIVIGGHKLSRGLTLEGLSISYFARNSKAYDTLMQMCRWFGYRPNYGDLCRVYLPQSSIDWYSFISCTIRELYQELELMSKREQRPSEFGLKVRQHPGAMIITAKNKMGHAQSETRSQDLWGQIQRRFRFKASEEVNRRNLEFTAQYVKQLIDKRFDTEDFSYAAGGSDAVILSNVSYSEIIDYIKSMDLPEDDLGNQALIHHLKKMEKGNLSLPKVAIFNQKNRGRMKREDDLKENEREFVDKNFELCEHASITLPKRKLQSDGRHFKVPSVHLGNSDDEKLFLPKESQELTQAEAMEQGKPKAVSFDYICSPDRDFAGLIIYLFAVAVEDSDTGKLTLGHGLMPTVGFTLSLPRPENLKGKTQKELKDIIKETKHSYQINKVHAKLQAISAYEEYEEDEND
ncbi:Z1 domain-containing protein [bacterium]|nr:Z1 domain-containing protein [bacterium]